MQFIEPIIFAVILTLITGFFSYAINSFLKKKAYKELEEEYEKDLGKELGKMLSEEVGIDLDELGEKVILFGANDKKQRREWRKDRVDTLIKKYANETSKLELRVLVGEFNSGARNTANYALKHDEFDVSIIGGPKVWCKDKEEIKSILNEKRLTYRTLMLRPRQHFMIFNKEDLFIEKFHKHNESRATLGIENANPILMKKYIEFFEKQKYGTEIKKTKDIEAMKCYSK